MSSDITVRVPAEPEFLHVLRTVLASVAARLNLSYDDIEDLRLAVDEACAQLLAIPAPASRITLRLTASDDRLELIVSSDAQPERWPPPRAEDSLAWRILTGLTDEAAFADSEEEPSLRLAKRVPTGQV